MNTALVNVLQKNRSNFRSVVDFNPAKEKLVKFDFTEANAELTVTDISNTEKFSQYIHNKLTQANANSALAVTTKTEFYISEASYLKVQKNARFI